jgi:polysaccharide transporter, PST family
LTTDALTGYFSVMHKLVQPLRMLEVVFSQTIFPIVCIKTKEGWAAVRAFLHRSFLLFSPLPLGGVLLLLLFAGPLLRYFAGEADESLIAAFRMYALVPAIVLFNIPAYQALLAYERKTAYTKVYLAATALKIFLDPALVVMYGLPGLAVSVLVVEGFITLGLYWMVVGEW